MKLVFTCLINGDDAAITNRMKAMKPENFNQIRDEDDIARDRVILEIRSTDTP